MKRNEHSFAILGVKLLDGTRVVRPSIDGRTPIEMPLAVANRLSNGAAKAMELVPYCLIVHWKT